MEAKEIFYKALRSAYLIIDEVQLQTVLSNSEILRVEDTCLSDFIRVLKYDGNLFVQETTLEKEIIIRKMNSMSEVDFFIQERLAFYERKWDGCGCKINYYE
jgi:hypothetical protein